MKRLMLILLIWGCVTNAAAQSGHLRFTVVDSTTREAVVGAVAVIENLPDKTESRYTTTKISGEGEIPNVRSGKWQLTIKSMGYDSLRTSFWMGTGGIQLDTLRLKPDIEELNKAVVEVPALRSSVSGDTLSYHAASYKVSFGSDAEALISKMPGLEVNEGVIEAQGRTVQRVYVDGREFFSNDAMSALKNIPSDMVKSIEVYQGRSDQSEFAGISVDDGVTTLNIVTHPDKNRGAFGRLYGAYGLVDKYIGGGNVNILDGERRISAVAMANNISRQNFSFEDILGSNDASEQSAANKNFSMRPLDGLSTVQAVGVNYNDNWGPKVKVAASYFFNHNDNTNDMHSMVQSFTASNDLVLNDNHTERFINTRNHRFNARFDLKLAPRHMLLIRANGTIQENAQRNETIGRTDNSLEESLRFVNRRHNFGNSNASGRNLTGSALYRYRLPGKRNQVLAAGLSHTQTNYKQWNLNRQYTFKDEDADVADTSAYSSRNISRTNVLQPGYTTSGNASYTVSVARRIRMSLDLRYIQNGNDVERNAYVLTKENVYPAERNPKQSTEYDYTFRTTRASLTGQYRYKKTRIAATMQYQHIDFSSRYEFPYTRRTFARFDNFTYNTTADIALNSSNTLKFDASGRTSNPRAADLQGIVNKTNRHNVFAGNPGLSPVYTHSFSGQYIHTNPKRGRTLTLAMSFAASPNTIADSLVIDTPDFIIDDEGTKLGEGNRYVRPVNIGGYRNLRGQVNYGMPVRWLRSNLNLRAAVSTGKMPSIINGQRNFVTNNAYNLGAKLGSNVSESIDFSLSYMGQYNVSHNRSALRSFDNTYMRHILQADAVFMLWNRVVFRANANYDCYIGLTDDFHEQRLVCNALLGVKLFRNRLGEASIGVNDIFDQNATTFRRAISGTALSHTTHLGVGRYISVQFTYHLRVYRRQHRAVMEHLKKAAVSETGSN